MWGKIVEQIKFVSYKQFFVEKQSGNTVLCSEFEIVFTLVCGAHWF